MHLRVIDNFISNEQQSEIFSYVMNGLVDGGESDNSHVKSVAAEINGTAMMCDMTKSNISSKVSKVHGGGILENVPLIFHNIKDQISERLNISKDNVFLQILSMQKGGKIKAHYDSGIPGFITYKCNIAVIAKDDYSIHVDKTNATIHEKSLYAFEANLYKHWVNEYPSHRILLSYGFIIPNDELGYAEDDPRVRLFNRIYEHYMKK